MMRSPSVIQSEYERSSSPDPLTGLADDFNLNAASPVHRVSGGTAAGSSRHAKTLSHSSQASNISISANRGDISPSKTITEQTLSPWKIRVTVEAEHEHEHEGDIRGRQEMVRTIKIPLRESSSPLQSQSLKTRNRREGSRTRSSPGFTARKSRQRSATPIGARRKRQSVTDLDAIVLGDDASEDEWGRKPSKSSPRKNRTRKSVCKVADVRPHEEQEDGCEVQSHSDAVGDDNNERGSGQMSSPEMREIDLNRVSLRPRSASVKQKSLSTADKDRVLPSTEPLSPGVKVSGMRKASAKSDASYPTPSPTPSEPCHEANGALARDQQADEPGFDTVMESEGFTMIDIDSIPSVRNLRNSPAEGSQPPIPTATDKNIRNASTETLAPSTRKSPDTNLQTFPSYVQLGEGESDISSGMPSSPPIITNQDQAEQSFVRRSRLQIPSSGPKSGLRHVTPATYSSPGLPSPPRPAPIQRKSPRNTIQVMRVGEVLNGAIQPTPEVSYPTLKKLSTITGHNPNTRTESTSEDKLFEGYDSSTKRELRAGLRFGEELAKRDQHVATDVLLEQNSNTTPPSLKRAEEIERQSQQGNDRGSSAQHVSSSPVTSNHKHLNTPKTTTAVSKEPATRELNTEARWERRWQNERENVIEQAKMATPSRVIVIDDTETDHDRGPDAEATDITMDETDGDIWLAEAKQVSSSSRGSTPEHSELTAAEEQERQRARAKEVVERPKRTMIPSPWKRGEEIDYSRSTVMTEGDGWSGLHWKQPDHQDLRFGAGQLRYAKNELRKSGATSFDKRASGAFDIAKMLGTPKPAAERTETHGAKTAVDDANSSAHSVTEDLEEYQQHQQDISNINSFTQVDNESTRLDYRQIQAWTMPVNSNEPTDDNESLDSRVYTPPQRSRASISPSKDRPATPKSAMKGGRQSIAGQASSSSDEPDTCQRKVAWARRASGVDEHWNEGSISVRSEDLPNSITQETESQEAYDASFQPSFEVGSQIAKAHAETQQPEPNRWFGWFRGGDDTAKEGTGETASVSDSDETHSSSPTADSHSTDDTSVLLNYGTHQEGERLYHPTSTQVTKSQVNSAAPASSSSLYFGIHSQRRTTASPKLPSYLLPPSYPSDPSRSTTRPLSTSGPFTNAHFRTLHIIYAKSSRPRFHAPTYAELRPEIKHLVDSRWSLYLDHSAQNLGGFEFKIGEREGRVLERFCREVELGYLDRLLSKQPDHELHRHQQPQHYRRQILHTAMGRGGMWGGDGVGIDDEVNPKQIPVREATAQQQQACSHGEGQVEWGWTVEELTGFLGRIVVGEVVRAEEYGGRDSESTVP